MGIAESDIHEILDRLARIETKIELRTPRCDEHTRRIEALEHGMGRQNFVASMMGALAAGMVLMIRFLAGK